MISAFALPVKRATPLAYLWAALACALAAAIATPLRHYLELSNIVMLFLLAVFLVAVRWGRGPAVLAAFLSVALFDFFFVPPRLSFAVSDVQYLITFAVMLAVALITGHLTAGLRQQAALARLKQEQTHALYEMARDLAGAVALTQVQDIVHSFLRRNFNFAAALLIPDGKDILCAVGAVDFQVDMQFALIAFEQNQIVEDNSISGYGLGATYFPLRSPMRVRGVLIVTTHDQALLALREQKPLLHTLASLIGIAVERLHYVEVAQAAQVENVSERLRSSILSALSHDLRTPLTVLVGLAESLTLIQPALPVAALETAQAIREQALRLSSLVGNLLDMARLYAGRVRLRKEWQPLEEVIGASIQLLGASLSKHSISVALPADLPLLEFDAVLIERVFCNLLENAAKYAPADSAIEIGALIQGAEVVISVCDAGPGLPDHGLALFDMFVRAAPESAAPGAGLGLAICRAIVEAHAGTLSASTGSTGGACLSFTLPLGTPPSIMGDQDLTTAECQHG